MKRFTILFFLISSIYVTSCDINETLQMEPLDKITNENFFKTDNDFKLYCNQFYNSLPKFASTVDAGMFWTDNNSDNMLPGSPNIRLAGDYVVPASGGGWDWTGIRKVNYLFDNVSKYNGPQSSIKQYIGEAKFFRAFYYFNLLKQFGDLPWVGKTLNTSSPELYASRISRAVIADSIIRDLDSAIVWMKPRAQLSGNDAFRISKEVALLFKGRVALFEGTWEKYHQNTSFGVTGSDGTKYLTAAAEATNTLMGLKAFSISNGNASNAYWSLFNQADYSNNKEVMLWAKYDVAQSFTNEASLYLRAGGGTGITRSMVNSYLCTDGKPIAVSPLYQGDNDLVNVSTNRDPRLKQTVCTPGAPVLVKNGVTNTFTAPNLGASGFDYCISGYQLYKGLNTDYNYQTQASTQGTIVFRYAEVLLINAEAKAELGTITQADLDATINLLRSRVGMPAMQLVIPFTDPNWDFPTLSPLINEIRRERRVELCAEGFRLDDLMRWRAGHLITGKHMEGGKFATTAVTVNANGYIEPYLTRYPNGFKFDPNRDYLLPIPTDQLQLNPNLKQNPGW